MAGSPKRQRFSRSSRKSLYRLVYFILVLGAIYAVRRSLRQLPQAETERGGGAGEEAASDAKALLTDAEKEVTAESATWLKDTVRQMVTGQESFTPETKTKLEKWIAKPTALCFGSGGANITILTVAVDLPKMYVKQMRRNRLLYIVKHGYRYCEVSQNLDFSRPVAWTNVMAMLLVLTFSDIVVHIDADALIVNKTLRFESVMNLQKYNTSGKDVIYTTDYGLGRIGEPNERSSINTGVYIMRSTQWSKKFLESQYKFYHASAAHQRSWEEEVVRLYRLKNPELFQKHVSVIPYRYMNVPCGHKQNDYVAGDFIVHYANGPSVEKYKRLADMFLQ